MKKISFHEDANAEMVHAAQYYEEKAYGLGSSFLDAVEDGVKKILKNPETYQLISDEIRHKILDRFPYSILYVIEPGIIRIIAVVHQKRRPGYWHYRI